MSSAKEGAITVTCGAAQKQGACLPRGHLPTTDNEARTAGDVERDGVEERRSR